MELNDSIKKAIAENMPAMVGTELMALLNQGKIDAAELARVTGDLTAMTSAYAKATTERDTARQELSRHAELTKRADEVKRREDLADLAAAKVELVAEKRISQFALETVKLLVRNTDFKTILNGTIPIPVEGNPGGGPSNAYPTSGTTMPSPINTTETKVAE